MSVIHGKGGSITISSTAVAEIRSFSLKRMVDITEAPAMGQTSKTKLAGIADWEATIECWLDDTPDGGQLLLYEGQEVTPTFTLKTGLTISGDAIVTDREVIQDNGGVVELKISVTGNGALTDGTLSGS